MKKVIAYTNLPARAPITLTLATITALHYFNASGWLWIISTIILIFSWKSFFGNVVSQQQIEVADHMVEPQPKLADIIRADERREQLKSDVFEALGYASMCWSETPKGDFDSTAAKRKGEEIWSKIEKQLK